MTLRSPVSSCSKRILSARSSITYKWLLSPKGFHLFGSSYSTVQMEEMAMMLDPTSKRLAIHGECNLQTELFNKFWFSFGSRSLLTGTTYWIRHIIDPK